MSARSFILVPRARRAARVAALLAIAALGPIFPTAASAQSCIPSGTDAAIQAALNGAGAVAQLCPGAVFNLSNPVRFTAPNQVLQTQGLPVDNTRAILRIASATLTNAILGNGQSGVTVQNVEVDGNIGTFGRLTGDALLFMGDQGSNQTVQNNFLHDTRSWSMLHMREGTVANGVPSCQNGRIVNNLIMSSGTNVPSGTWADGISLACGTTLVQGNTIVDATDGSIVIFGAPGSTIQNNTVIAQSRVMLGGINLVDFNPVGGNYTGTRVLNNVIDARGALIKVGVASGPGTWFCEPDTTVNRGAVIQGNTLQGTHMGYGFAVRGVAQWEVTGNTDNSSHSGVAGSMCGGGTQNPQAPAGFQFYAPATQANLQSQFQAVTGNFWGLLNITENVGTAPLVYAQRTSLSYAPVAAGQASTPQSVTITNTGPATASITGVTINGDFTQTNNCSSLATGSSCVVYVTFRPSVTGTRTGTLTVNSNAGNGAATVSLTGTGDTGTPVGTIATNPASLTFPATPVGGGSAAQTVTVSNTGSAALNFSSITPSGDFTQTNNCAALAAGASCIVSVTFRPSASGARTGSLTITSSASNSPNIVSLSGTGGAVTSSNIALGKPTTASSVTQNFVAANATDGNASTYWESLNNAFPQWLQVDLGSSQPLDRVVLKLPPVAAWAMRTETLTVQISESGATFAIIVGPRDCLFDPNSGNTCVIPLPAGTSSRYVRLNFTANTGWPAGQVSEFEVWSAVTGLGLLAANPGSVAFGNQPINTTSPTSPVTITNTGTAAAIVSGVTLGGEFQQTHNCGTLAGNASCTVNVTFRPTTAGAKSGTLTINSNASNSSLAVAISGTGINATATLSANPTSLAFGNQAVNTSSTARVVIITNTGSASATVSGVTVGAEFLQSHNCSTLAAGGSCTVNVTFRPTTTGAKSATLTVNSNATNPSLGVGLTGTGVAVTGTLSANPASLVFGNQNLNTTSAAQVVTITNTGSAAAAVSGVATTDGQFAQTSNCATLNAGATCTVNVTFRPTTSGAKSATLTISSNASNPSLGVGLSGTGVSTTTDLAAGRPATASSVQQSYVASNVTDVNQASYWESQNNAFNPSQWVQVDLGAALTVGRVVLKLPTNWGARDQTLSVLGSTNNSSWSTLSGSGARTFSPTANTVIITFPASSQRYIRIDITANTGWPAGQLSSFEVYSQ